MIQETRDMLVGGLVVVLLGGVLAISYGSEGVGDEEVGATRIEAVFNRVDGLVVGDEVRMGGVKIGTVSGEQLDRDYRAVISLSIDSGVPLPLDSSAAIHTDGLFGSKYVVIEPGGDENNLKTGDRITFTQDAVIVSELLELIISQGKARQAAAQPKEQ